MELKHFCAYCNKERATEEMMAHSMRDSLGQRTRYFCIDAGCYQKFNAAKKIRTNFRKTTYSRMYR